MNAYHAYLCLFLFAVINCWGKWDRDRSMNRFNFAVWSFKWWTAWDMIGRFHVSKIAERQLFKSECRWKEMYQTYAKAYGLELDGGQLN